MALQHGAIHLVKPKNMPGDMPLHNKKFSGGKGPTQGGGPSKMHTEGGDFGKDQHGLHGHDSKAVMTSKGSKKK